MRGHAAHVVGEQRPERRPRFDALIPELGGGLRAQAISPRKSMHERCAAAARSAADRLSPASQLRASARAAM